MNSEDKVVKEVRAALEQEPRVNLHHYPVEIGYDEGVVTLEGETECIAGKKLALILPVGPMGMYRWAIFFLKEWKVPADHVFGFNMDEWSDAEGNTLPSDNPGSFRYAMEDAFYGPLGDLTIPAAQRNFATRENLPMYPKKIGELLSGGAELAVVFGIGRVYHIAFWEPHFAAEFRSVRGQAAGTGPRLDTSAPCRWISR